MKEKEIYDFKKKLIELKRKLNLEGHENKMKELEFARESTRIFHENEMTRGRIKSAEIRKSQERKAHFDDYNKRKY